MKKIVFIALLLVSFGSSIADVNSTVTVNTKSCAKDTPCLVIKKMATALNQAAGKSTEQSVALVQNDIVSQFDFHLITRYIVGDNWKVATPEQQEKISSLFKQMLVSTYLITFSKFKGASTTIIDSTINADNQNKAIVTTSSAIIKDKPISQPISVEYDLAKIKGSWKIYDMKVENISTITTYRGQFSDIIMNEGIDGLISKLQSKVAELKTKK